MSNDMNPYLIRCPSCKTRNRIPADKLGGAARCGKCQATIRTGDVLIEQPLLVTDANFQDKILASPIPVLIFAWAPWCPSCTQIAPQFDAFASESRGRVRAGKLNVDANPVLAQRFNILSVPFMFVFDNGQLRQSLPGGLRKHDMMMLMAAYI
ncbi:MAG: thioredoxin domain-containing protein [Desulfobacterales bacterium]|jgi:thioredoxin 2